jgi:hypothetical protein
MSSYLAGYGAGEARRAKLIQWAVIGAVLAVVLGIVGYFFGRHYAERAQLAVLVEAVRSQNHAAGHAAFGCTKQAPCRDYSLEKYLRDFGPQGEYRTLAEARVVEKWSCQGGIIRVFDFGGDKQLELFVANTDKLVSFAPPRQAWKGCNILP